MSILKAGEHQIMLTNEALEERESSMIHSERVGDFPHRHVMDALTHPQLLRCGLARVQGWGQLARGSRVAFSQAANQPRQAGLL